MNEVISTAVNGVEFDLDTVKLNSRYRNLTAKPIRWMPWIMHATSIGMLFASNPPPYLNSASIYMSCCGLCALTFISMVFGCLSRHHDYRRQICRRGEHHFPSGRYGAGDGQLPCGRVRLARHLVLPARNQNSKIFPDTPLTTDELLNMRMDEQEGKSLHFRKWWRCWGRLTAILPAEICRH